MAKSVLGVRCKHLMAACLPAGICPLPSRHWSDTWVYAPSPHDIGPISGYMPPPLTPLVRREHLMAACLPVHMAHPPYSCRCRAGGGGFNATGV
eukprot:237331-Prorocentrum_minimum.AAC.1